MKELIYIFILLIIFSCQKEKIKKPENFINKNKMVELILDMKIAEKAKTVVNKNKKRKKNYMNLVFEKYQIDSTQFKENNAYYTENLELYEEIYTEIQKRLNDSVKKYEILKKEKDSIAREKNRLKNQKKKTDTKKLKSSKKNINQHSKSRNK